MKNIEIQIPKGHEIDLDLSNLKEGKIVFKEVKTQISYKDVTTSLFDNKTLWFTGANGDIITDFDIDENHFNDSNQSATKAQLESILALNKLCNVAKYLNGDWLPNWMTNTLSKWSIAFDIIDNCLIIDYDNSIQNSKVYFKTKELAQQALEILGEEEIRKALTLNH